MPFTPTHIAAAIPLAWLCRWRVPFSALAIGTVVSDIPVYFPSLMSYEATHTMKGVLTHCTPVGLVLYYFYHGVLKRPLVDLLPKSLRDRLLPFINRPIRFDPSRVLLVTGLVALGAATHVFWDSFTHPGRWGTQVIPWLQQVAIEGTQPPVRWYAIMQHASSILFLPPLIIGFFFWVLRQPEQGDCDDRKQLPLAVSWTVIALLAVGGCLRLVMIKLGSPHYLWISVLRLAVKDTGAVALAVMLVYCLAMQTYWLFGPTTQATDERDVDLEELRSAKAS